jgi:hypothetical protein
MKGHLRLAEPSLRLFCSHRPSYGIKNKVESSNYSLQWGYWTQPVTGKTRAWLQSLPPGAFCYYLCHSCMMLTNLQRSDHCRAEVSFVVRRPVLECTEVSKKINKS